MREFASLTMHGRARRLRGVAHKALERYDIDVIRVRLVNNEANCTFRIDADGGCSYALRINLPGMSTRQGIRSEMIWQEAIWRDTDIAVPRPIRANNGDLVVAANGDGVQETRLCNLSTWVYGRTFSSSKTFENFRRLGNLTARLHRHGATFSPPPEFDMPVLDTVLPSWRPDVLFGDGRLDELPDSARHLIIELREALESDLQRMFRPGSKPQLIHADLHWWNVLIYRGTLHPIDFEDSAWAFPIQDIAITFCYVLWDERFPDFVDAYREGYEQVQPWPEEYDGQFELMIGQKALRLLNLLMASPYRNERELIPEYVDIIDKTYRPYFERWQSLQS